jgi:hypothetical protein
VLTSSITDRSREITETVLDADLDEIWVPTLIVHHKQDGCVVTRYNSARLLPGQLKKAPRKEFLGFEGGGVSVGDPSRHLPITATTVSSAGSSTLSRPGSKPSRRGIAQKRPTNE